MKFYMVNISSLEDVELLVLVLIFLSYLRQYLGWHLLLRSICRILLWLGVSGGSYWSVDDGDPPEPAVFSLKPK